MIRIVHRYTTTQRSAHRSLILKPPKCKREKLTLSLRRAWRGSTRARARGSRLFEHGVSATSRRDATLQAHLRPRPWPSPRTRCFSASAASSPAVGWSGGTREPRHTTTTARNGLSENRITPARHGRRRLVSTRRWSTRLHFGSARRDVYHP
jgi:hypothetical protein